MWWPLWWPFCSTSTDSDRRPPTGQTVKPQVREPRPIPTDSSRTRSGDLLIQWSRVRAPQGPPSIAALSLQRTSAEPARGSACSHPLGRLGCGGRPPNRPCSFERASPRRVFCWIVSTLSWTKVATTPNNALPIGVVASISSSVSDFNSPPFPKQVDHLKRHCFTTCQTIQGPHHESVAFSHVAQARLPLWPVGADAVASDSCSGSPGA